MSHKHIPSFLAGCMSQAGTQGMDRDHKGKAHAFFSSCCVPPTNPAASRERCLLTMHWESGKQKN